MDTPLATAVYDVDPRRRLCVKIIISRTFALSIELIIWEIEADYKRTLCFDSQQIKLLKPILTDELDLKVMLRDKEMCRMSMEAWGRFELILQCVRNDIEIVSPYLIDPNENSIIKDRFLLRSIIALCARNEYENKIGLYCKACYTWSRRHSVNMYGFCALCTETCYYIDENGKIAVNDVNVPPLEHTENCIKDQRAECLLIAKCALLNIKERQLATILLNSRIGCLGISKEEVMGKVEAEMAQKCVDGTVYSPLTQLLLHMHKEEMNLPQYFTAENWGYRDAICNNVPCKNIDNYG